MVRRRSKRKPRKVFLPDETVSASQSDTISEQLSPVADQAKAFEQEFAAAHTAIIKRFDDWISSLEGKKFPVDAAEQEIAAITHAVARAGRQLLYQGRPVTLYCDNAPGRRHAKVIVMTIGVQPQQRLYEKVEVPQLKTRPIP